MATITTRAGKGSPLTNAEVDANFNNLNNDKAENGVNADITALSAITGGIASPDSVDFDTAASVVRQTGRLNWNDTEGTLEVGLKGSDVTLQIGQEIVTYAFNSDASIINNGEVVYFFSSASGKPAVKKFIADRTVNAELVIGLATEDISVAGNGYVTEFGVVRGIDTSAFSVGDILYADASTAGALTNTRPASPNAVVILGVVLDVDAVAGTILVNPHKVPDADEIFYDNTESGLTASNVKGAIDELELNKADISLLQAEVTFFATTAASDIATYNKLVTSTTDADYDSTAVNVSTGTLTTAETLISSIASDSNVLEGDVASITVTTIGNIRRTAGNGAARFWFEVYHRTSGGTETLIGTGNKTDYTSSDTYTQFVDSAFLASQVFTTTDRVVLKFYGQAESQDVTFDFQFGGTSPIRTLFPVPAALVPTTTTANTITTDTTNFNGTLSGSDTTVQAALDTLDNYVPAISDVTNLQTTLDAKAPALEFAVVNNGAAAYTFDGTGTDSDDNPTLYLYRGMTYEFNVNASGHPFYIKTTAGTGTGDQYTDNVTNNGVQVGTLTWEVQMDAPDTLYYQCSVHAAMVGTIVILDRDDNLKSFADTFTLPTTDGTDGQVLTTDGAGNLQLESPAPAGVTTGKAIAMAIVFGG